MMVMDVFVARTGYSDLELHFLESRRGLHHLLSVVYELKLQKAHAFRHGMNAAYFFF